MRVVSCRVGKDVYSAYCVGVGRHVMCMLYAYIIPQLRSYIFVDVYKLIHFMFSSVCSIGSIFDLGWISAANFWCISVGVVEIML